MWSFAVLLWELVTREVPFADLSNMEIGMKVRAEQHTFVLGEWLVMVKITVVGLGSSHICSDIQLSCPRGQWLLST